MAARTRLVSVLLEIEGQTYSEEIGIRLDRNKPSPLFRWLVASTLLSARINHSVAVSAAKALSREGWRTAEKMAASTWRARTKVLNKSGYARYDESTSRMLGDTADKMLNLYSGDLRELRKLAGHDPAEERKLLKAFKGIGDVGADIFFRETQLVWREHYPFADKKALSSAEKIGLPATTHELAKLVPEREFPRLLSALVRTSLDKRHKEMKERAQ